MADDARNPYDIVHPPRPSTLHRQISRARARQRNEGDDADANAGPPVDPAPTPPRRRARKVSGDMPAAAALRAGFDRWFAERGWAVFDFQREVWMHAADGQSGLLHASTGAGKTWAAWGAALLAAARAPGPGL
ncbi:MAG: hypothetical protein QM639_19770, partial [Rhodocyclaceae bacterium]